ncbi:MAG: dockerin type I repeat-containing protein, partial [Clostridia bacterium]|nr:dockerin type I repeat-containing protein [Clostridia bacterium]
CCVCYDDYHCVECDECFEVNGQCESGGDHCAVCCENNGWLCPECGECIEVSGATVCRDCGVCENCAEFCGICGDFCIECAMFEEKLHCGECGECFEGNALMYCSDCYLCENCTEMCPECWDYCADCGVKSGTHCPDCKGCYSIYGECGECGKCGNCIDYCDECGHCSECAVEFKYHCVDCGVCADVLGRAYEYCWDCMKCSDCLGDEYCWVCGGCRECLAKEFNYEWHCAVCLACDSEIDFCQDCGVCEDCCLCGVTSGINGKVEGIKKNETVEIMLIPFGKEEPLFEKTATADDDDYSFDNVPAGKYVLRIVKNGEVIYEENIIVGKETASHNPNVSPEPSAYLLGDVNSDGAINQYDYILVKRHYFGTRYLTDIEMLPADVNEDGKVDQYDYILICRHYFGTFVIA